MQFLNRKLLGLTGLHLTGNDDNFEKLAGAENE